MILVRLTGGLGNQLFQYALGFALAKKNKVSLQIDVSLLGDKPNNKANTVIRNLDIDVFPISAVYARSNLVEKFNGKEKPNILDKFVFKIRKTIGRYPLTIQNSHTFIDFSDAKYQRLCIVGRWQSEDYFKDFAHEIKKEFSWSKFTVNEYSTELLAKNKEFTLISVQVRRGDYITHPEYSKTIGGLTFDYYKKAIEKIKSLLQNDKKYRFLIVSDDIKWCENNFEHKEDIIFVHQEKSKIGYVSDLWLLTQCQHAIISNSTFSWWGAWLGENENSIIISPKNWTRQVEHSPNIVPDRWIQMDNEFESLN